MQQGLELRQELASALVLERRRAVQPIHCIAGPSTSRPQQPAEDAEDATLDEDEAGRGEAAQVGALAGEVIAMPGHTPACAAYRFGEAVFDDALRGDLGSVNASGRLGDKAASPYCPSRCRARDR